MADAGDSFKGWASAETVERHHEETKRKFAGIEERVHDLEVGDAKVSVLLEDIRKKVEGPRWWVIAPLMLAIGALIYQAGRLPDPDDYRQMGARLAGVETEMRVQRILIDIKPKGASGGP